jgi:hypothetical protein
MIISWTNLLIIVVALASLYLALGSVVSLALRRGGAGLLRRRREMGAFLAASHTPDASVLGCWYMPLVSVGIPSAATRGSRAPSGSSFSRSFAQSPFCLPCLNDGRIGRQFWDAVASKGQAA